jgi:hypothetical protein
MDRALRAETIRGKEALELCLQREIFSRLTIGHNRKILRRLQVAIEHK